MVVTVNRDLFGIGYLVNSADLSVGSAGCSATSSDSVANTVLFSIQLQDCGSTFQLLSLDIPRLPELHKPFLLQACQRWHHHQG
ncbi:zona pellucida sperm-binding protein 3-like [Acipenser oxyrinchus oxyrinchus]|uniref:Zona pellucida sperm-binding protein 3-like n=1 Tax=Acipenser oxyrinchus oxyrinchus TaxID=40147 RepID=A0AAD8CR05_ACIOX|nr:zona pellucida sperm-binding protein 3-like [Acipenser oxyrinchus oxyrinchus]